MRQYVAVRPVGISRTLMNLQVSVPLTSFQPWKSLPISMHIDRSQCLPSELLRSSVYSASRPVSGLTAFKAKCLGAWSTYIWSRGSSRMVKALQMAVSVAAK